MTVKPVLAHLRHAINKARSWLCSTRIAAAFSPSAPQGPRYDALTGALVEIHHLSPRSPRCARGPTRRARRCGREGDAGGHAVPERSAQITCAALASPDDADDAVEDAADRDLDAEDVDDMLEDAEDAEDWEANEDKEERLTALETLLARGRRPRTRLLLGDSFGRVGVFEPRSLGFRALLRGADSDGDDDEDDGSSGDRSSKADNVNDT